MGLSGQLDGEAVLAVGKFPRAEELVTGLGHGDLVSAAEQHGLGLGRGVIIVGCNEPDVDFIVRLVDAYRLEGLGFAPT